MIEEKVSSIREPASTTDRLMTVSQTVIQTCRQCATGRHGQTMTSAHTNLPLSVPSVYGAAWQH